MKYIATIITVLGLGIGSVANAQLPDSCTKMGATAECLGLKAGAFERLIIQNSTRHETLPQYIREFISYKIVQGDNAIIETLNKNSNIDICCQFNCDNSSTCSQQVLPRQSCSIIAGRAISANNCLK